MMIPPHIRTGPPPPRDVLEPKAKLVVLTRAGWLMVAWHPTQMVLLDEDAVAAYSRYVNPHEVLCWMPADGS